MEFATSGGLLCILHYILYHPDFEIITAACKLFNLVITDKADL